MFCHRYFTGTCAWSNSRVGSSWDNIAPLVRAAVKPRGETATASIRDDKVNQGESLINVVNRNKPKVLTDLIQWAMEPHRRTTLRSATPICLYPIAKAKQNCPGSLPPAEKISLSCYFLRIS